MKHTLVRERGGRKKKKKLSAAVELLKGTVHLDREEVRDLEGPKQTAGVQQEVLFYALEAGRSGRRYKEVSSPSFR